MREYWKCEWSACRGRVWQTHRYSISQSANGGKNAERKLWTASVLSEVNKHTSVTRTKKNCVNVTAPGKSVVSELEPSQTIIKNYLLSLCKIFSHSSEYCVQTAAGERVRDRAGAGQRAVAMTLSHNRLCIGLAAAFSTRCIQAPGSRNITMMEVHAHWIMIVELTPA